MRGCAVCTVGNRSMSRREETEKKRNGVTWLCVAWTLSEGERAITKSYQNMLCLRCVEAGTNTHLFLLV